MISNILFLNSSYSKFQILNFREFFWMKTNFRRKGHLKMTSGKSKLIYMELIIIELIPINSWLFMIIPDFRCGHSWPSSQIVMIQFWQFLANCSEFLPVGKSIIELKLFIFRWNRWFSVLNVPKWPGGSTGVTISNNFRTRCH